MKWQLSVVRIARLFLALTGLEKETKAYIYNKYNSSNLDLT